MAAPLSEDEIELAAQAEPRLTALVQAEFGFVWRLLRRVGVPESDADDAAQQVFIAFSRRLAEIRPGSERAFLFSTALHVGARVIRGRKRRQEDFGLELDERADSAPSAEALIDRRRARQLLDRILEQMPLELRVVFVLYEIEQLTSAEIADVVGVPVGTVASRLRRAREDFSERLARLEARRKFGGKADD